MKRVVQQLNRDCFFCSVAMAAGLTYDELGKKVGWKIMSRVGDGGSRDDGTESADWRKILEAAGFTLDTDKYYGNVLRVWTAPGYVGTQMIKSLLWGRRAIIDVYCGGSDNHAVYWDGQNIHDPSPAQSWGSLHDIYQISNVFLIKDEVAAEEVEVEERQPAGPLRNGRVITINPRTQS